jgi:hypothetical protein
MNIILTIIIIVLATISIRFVWKNNIDYLSWFSSKLPNIPVTKDVPVLQYGISSLGSPYKVGLEIEGLSWRLNYSNHVLTIVNSTNEDVFNAIVSISLPAGIVKNKIESSVNVYNVNISSFNQPMIIGNARIEETFTNYCDISIEKLNKHSTLTIGFILDYRFKPKECWNNHQGYWDFDISYEYESKKDTKLRCRFINPIKIVTEKPLSIIVDFNTNSVNMDNIKGTHDTYPFNPLISKPDGSFVQIDKFNGNFDDIKLSKGEGLINSMGLDYTINTNEQYK